MAGPDNLSLMSKLWPQQPQPETEIAPMPFQLSHTRERMVPAKFYVHVKFYCLHYFRGPQLLMYSEFRKVDVHDGLVKDKGHHLWGFQDIRVIQHMCAMVQAAEGRAYFVDERETMEERLREALGAR
jgi:hypothetical protein